MITPLAQQIAAKEAPADSMPVYLLQLDQFVTKNLGGL
jgi:hypothetical protein